MQWVLEGEGCGVTVCSDSGAPRTGTDTGASSSTASASASSSSWTETRGERPAEAPTPRGRSLIAPFNGSALLTLPELLSHILCEDSSDKLKHMRMELRASYVVCDTTLDNVIAGFHFM
jgi:hypothetical protein